MSLASGDLDGDGIPDLIAGYSVGGSGFIAIQRGNLDAFAPQSTASLLAIGRGQFPSPFLPQRQIISVPVTPDFLVTGDFSGSGRLDLAFAARGGNAVYILAGNGKGGFAPTQAFSLNGSVTTLAAGNLARAQVSSLLLGLSDPQTGFSLAVMDLAGTPQILTATAAFSMPAAVSNIVFGDFGDVGNDAAFLSGGDVILLHATSMQLEQLSLPVSASAMAIGSFIYDRNPHTQFALLTSDGNIQIAVHSEFNPHTLSVDEMRTIRQAVRNGEPNPLVPQRAVTMNGWKIVETVPAAGSFAAGQTPVFFRTRISDRGSDDLMLLDASSGQMVVVSHPDLAPDTAAFAPAQISTMPYSGSAVAALPMRTNIDGRPGVVALHAGQAAPMVMMPLPDPTFFPNRFDDPAIPLVAGVPDTANFCNNISNADTSSPCSLREALVKANLTAGTDTIQLAAGTYTLSIPKVAGNFSGQFGALYVNDSVNIVGAGQNLTIIQAGTTAANGVDMVMAVNEDISPITNATASLSNLTLKFGHNNGTHGNDGDGGCMEFDTGSSGNANLTLTNVTLDTCSTTKGNGAGIAIFNFVLPNNGLATFANSIVQNNTAVDTTAGVGAGGGGIWVSQNARMSMANSQVLNNNATQVNGTGLGIGGGIFIFNNTSNSRQTVIHGSTISGNKSAGFGGGIWSSANLLVDQSSVISGNTAGTDGVNPIAAQNGGGFYLNTSSNGCPAACTDQTTLTQVTITGNTATGDGGAIATGNNTGAGNLNISFSRIAGNSATAGSNNLDNNHTTANVTNNWWGTVLPANTIHNNVATTNFDPFITLTHSASPSPIRINQSTTLTGDISKDNHGTAVANITQLIGLPITFNNAVLGTIPQAQPETIGATGTATATFNAGGTSGLGKADATVDQAVVTATFPILEPLQITKSFGAATIPVNGTTTVNFAVNNPNVIAVDGSFTDTFPVGLLVAATPGVSNTCGGTVTATAGSGSVSFSNASLPVGACSISVNVTGTVDSVLSNSVTINSTAAGTGTQSTSTANLTVINPPGITKAFGAASIPLNGTTSLTFTLSSTNQNLALTGVAFTDNLPAGLVVAATPNLSNTCGGTATAVGGSSSVSLSGASLAPGASCTVSVDIQGTTAGLKNNSVQVTSGNGGTGNTSNASITVVAPPVIIKAFGAASIPLNGSTSLSFTIQNNNAATSLTGVAFGDTLPAGLVISTPNGLTGSCGGGTITATQATNVISLSGASLAASTSCTFSVNVTGIAAGSQNNTTSNVTSTEGGTGGTASASVKVEAPPSIAKVFNPSTITVNATTSLTFTITNPAANVDPLTGVAFTDTLPTGLTVANASATVCGGTLTTTAPTGISLSGATIAVNSQCQFSVTVTGAASGQYTNTTGNVTSTNGGTGNTASANLTVALSPPIIIKAFGAASIPLNGSTSLSFTIQNNNTTTTLTGVGFADTLPAGLVISTPNGLTGTCGGGTITATQATKLISLSGGSIAASSSCTFSVNVTGTAAGLQNNTTGNVTSTEAGAGGTASASVKVEAPPSIAKVFNPSSIALNATSSLTFTITNPAANVDPLTGVAFTDTLPTGLTVANATAAVCGGTLTTTAPTGISLSGSTVAVNGQCQFSVTVTGAAAGQFTNTTGNVTSTNGGTGNTASANLSVATPPTITKAFGAASILLNASTSVTFNISNPNTTVALTGIAFSDALPAGLVVATPSGLTSTCGGTTTAVAGSGSISLSGGTLAANGSCTIGANVTGVQAGVQNNTTGPISSTESGAGATSNTASITVIGPPNIAKAFGAASINLNATTTLTFTITNPNATMALTGVGFGDTLPGGITIANPNGLTGSCGAGTITTGTISGGSVVNLSGGTIAAGGSCTFSINVVGTTGGHKVNTTGTVSSSNAGSGNQATASIDVFAPDATITKTHTGTFTRGQTGALWTITVSNVGFGPTVGTVTVTDTLPNIPNPPVATAISGTGWTCTLATLTCTRADALAAGSSYPAITLTVNIPINIQNNFTNTATVSGGGDVNPANNTATDAVTLGPPIVITPLNTTASVIAGSAATFTFTVQDSDPSLGLIAFGCSGLPVGTACNFNPPATNQPSTQVVLTLTTSGGDRRSLGQSFFPGGNSPLYTMLFPLLGLLGLTVFSRGRMARLRLAMVFAGILMLLTFAGCGGGGQRITTPPGSYPITVTAATTTVQASAQVTLTVQ